MLNDSVLKEIKKLTVGSADDRPLWQPSIREGAPDKIEGFNYVVNNDMEDLSAVSNKIFAFGDWSRYYVRIAQDIILARSTDRYVEEYVVGYFLFLRADGELMDTNAIKTMALAAS
jgi:HK97 family phage major capsid protein